MQSRMPSAMRMCVLASILFALGCGGYPSSHYPGVHLSQSDEVVELSLEEDCGPAEGQLEWLEVTGAELEPPSVLLLRVDHALCPEARFRVCGSNVVIDTDPGIWEVSLAAYGPGDATGCGEDRTSVLRVDLSSNSVGRSGHLDFVGAVHENPSRSDEERTRHDLRREPRSVDVDIRLAPDDGPR